MISFKEKKKTSVNILINKKYIQIKNCKPFVTKINFYNKQQNTNQTLQQQQQQQQQQQCYQQQITTIFLVMSKNKNKPIYP